MTGHRVARTLAVAVAIGLVVPAPIDSVRWWRSSRIADRLRLSPSQAAAIDEIYQGAREQAATCARDSAEARRQLDVVLMSDGADDAFAATASRAAEAEAACRRARTVMLYRMFRQLSPRQRQRLAELGGGQRTSVRSPRPGDSLITNDVRAY